MVCRFIKIKTYKTLFANIYCHQLVWALIVCVSMLMPGCSNAVQYTLATDYNKKMPNSIVVLPVAGEANDADVRHLLRSLVQQRLIQTGYSPIPIEIADDKLLRKGITRDDAYTRTPKEIASALDVDAVLYTTVTEWDTTLFLSYVSLDTGVKLELYSGGTGEKLWEAEFDTEDSDMSMERDVVELGIIKAYEPVVQRVVDAVFSTFPANKATVRGSPQKSYYDWLP